MPNDFLYVVKRPFRSNGKWFHVGDILEDLGVVKLGKIKVSEGKLVRIPKDKESLNHFIDYFKARTGIDLAERLAERVSKGSRSAEPVKPDANATPQPGTPDDPPKDEAPKETPKEATTETPKETPQAAPAQAPKVVAPTAQTPKTTTAKPAAQLPKK